jgi:hydrogenase maturation factor
VTGDPCGSDHCVTCADEGIPMTVVEPTGDGAALCADGVGAVAEVMTELVGPVAGGDSVLVHAGVALTRLPQSPEDFAG